MGVPRLRCTEQALLFLLVLQLVSSLQSGLGSAALGSSDYLFDDFVTGGSARESRPAPWPFAESSQGWGTAPSITPLSPIGAQPRDLQLLQLQEQLLSHQQVWTTQLDDPHVSKSVESKFPAQATLEERRWQHPPVWISSATESLVAAPATTSRVEPRAGEMISRTSVPAPAWSKAGSITSQTLIGANLPESEAFGAPLDDIAQVSSLQLPRRRGDSPAQHMDDSAQRLAASPKVSVDAFPKLMDAIDELLRDAPDGDKSSQSSLARVPRAASKDGGASSTIQGASDIVAGGIGTVTTWTRMAISWLWCTPAELWGHVSQWITGAR
eukprot:TRINITY_DN541_c0_g2_i1.p1 TRINITY_DN541_c0_g2~~TRINITY_DN541_c0_g2_i1.p1  ORF type:complete len:326 (-),score=40.11 TRINITY_DN541_c0_g2_i1:49-1026(-)